MQPHEIVKTVALVLASIVVPAAIWASIFRQAGYAGRLGLIALIPGALLVLPFVIGLLTWPIHRELDNLRDELGENAKVDLARLPQGV